jgi:hypothetical protein
MEVIKAVLRAEKGGCGFKFLYILYIIIYKKNFLKSETKNRETPGKVTFEKRFFCRCFSLLK